MVGGGDISGILLPGWVITNLIFPKVYETINQFERILLSLGISIGIAIFSGLILDDVWIIDSFALTTTIGSFSLFILIISLLNRILIGLEKYRNIINKISQVFSKKKVE